MSGQVTAVGGRPTLCPALALSVCVCVLCAKLPACVPAKKQRHKINTPQLLAHLRTPLLSISLSLNAFFFFFFFFSVSQNADALPIRVYFYTSASL